MSKRRDAARERTAPRNAPAWSANTPSETKNRGTQRSATLAQFLVEAVLFGLIVRISLQVATWASRLETTPSTGAWDRILFTCVAMSVLTALLTLSTIGRPSRPDRHGQPASVIVMVSVGLIIALAANKAILRNGLLVVSPQIVAAGILSVAAILFERSWLFQNRQIPSPRWAFISNRLVMPVSAPLGRNLVSQSFVSNRERTTSMLITRANGSAYADTQATLADVAAFPPTDSSEISLVHGELGDGLVESSTIDSALGEVIWISTELSWPRSSSRSPRRSIKRLLDVAVSLTALLVLSPMMLLLALLIKLESRGPALFVQTRVGQNGKTFNLLKFRSMRVDAEHCTGPVFAKPNDPRCTRVGRLMRRHSLDELPQLINVLRGDMSIVGPRPERPYFVVRFSQTVPRYVERHREKAGITGWAQVNGRRGDTSIEERVRYDLHYVEHWSLVFDLKIMLRTVVEILQGHNAY